MSAGLFPVTPLLPRSPNSGGPTAPRMRSGAPRVVAPAANAPAGPLILVADDEPQIRATVARILRCSGYRVVLASDGAEGADLFAAHAAEIRLVITDLSLPKLDGATLGLRVRAANAATRVLIVSGSGPSLDGHTGYRLEECADALLLKPFTAETLLRFVAELLGTERPAFGIR